MPSAQSKFTHSTSYAALFVQRIGNRVSLTILLALFSTAGYATNEQATRALVENRGTYGDLKRLPQIQKQLITIAKNLPTLQRKEIKSHMKDIWNVDIGRRDPVKFVRDLSQQNLLRLISPDDERPSPEFQAATAYIRRHSHGFHHNTAPDPGTHFKSQTLILSSDQLKNLGLNPGIQDHSIFNTKMLGTSNWLFFFVGEDDDRVYGNNSLIIDEYGADQAGGLILPFIMNPEDLLIAAEFTAPESMAQLEELIKSVYPKAWRLAEKLLIPERDSTPASKVIAAFRNAAAIVGSTDNQRRQEHLMAEHWEIFDGMRQSLANFTFTPADFRRLETAALARELRKDPDFLKKSGSLAEVRRRAGLPSRFEMRIPVALPTWLLSRACDQFLTLNNWQD